MGRVFNGVKKRVRDGGKRIKNAYLSLFAPHRNTLQHYNGEYPDPQQMIDLFKDEWMSCFPFPYQNLKAGIYPLFDDQRLAWGIRQLGGGKGKKVIELGPLEGGHSYMLEKEGVASNIAIEANPRAYLKCLLVKELFQLKKSDFLFGDFNQYLNKSPQTFDLCVASGVLYHMKNPVELLKLIAGKSDELFLWTQYYDPKICSHPVFKSKFFPPVKHEVDGFKHILYPFKYGASRFWSTFIGGPAKTSSWLARQDILDALHYFGFTDIQVGFEEINPTHGPCFALVAKK